MSMNFGCEVFVFSGVTGELGMAGEFGVVCMAARAHATATTRIELSSKLPKTTR
ncbi:hypothetical protein HMPREF3208_00951 [Gardnerella vaginalis]|uniref:Uncharacterized protein n=1 Tax=Gardnerella vaginalis TaxID=2702 RepID=A0A133NU78_GARVA|nr:hypothetical protein [Gardnerella vaginalis]KXA19854.1 hypothetical protein HMPREF3208_00951 [Gardnerella vaginalis]